MILADSRPLSSFPEIPAMASGAPSSSSQAQAPQAQAHEGMVVDLESREKRKAEIPVPSDSDDDALHATPAENPNPTAAMSVEDLVRYSIQQNEKHFHKLDKDMSKLQREGSETRKMAARAVTTAEDTRQKVDKLERRLNALEAKANKPPEYGHTNTASTGQTQRSEWQELGGEEGDTIVLGGFRKNSTADERRAELAEVEALLADDVKSQIADKIIPATRTEIVLLKIVHSDKGPDETRRNNLALCAKIKAANIKRRTGDEPERTIYAGASKPFHIRQHNAQTYVLYEALKSFFPEPDQEHVTMEARTGRVFFHNHPIATRPRGTQTTSPCLAELQKHVPGITMDMITAKRQEVDTERDRLRNNQ